MSDSVSPLILLADAALALGCLVLAFHFYRRRRLIDDTPTSKTKGVFIGLAEIKGSAESESPLDSYLAGARCVWYSYKVEEHWRRVTVNAKGHATTQTGWSQVAHETRSVPIFLKDDTGVVRILPEGAEVHGDEVFKKEVKREDPLYYGKGPENAVSGSTHRRRFTEQVLTLHEVIYVIGQARLRSDAVAAEVARAKGSMFIVSTHDEKHHSDRFRLWYWLWLGIGLVLAAGGTAIYSQQGIVPPPVLPVILTTAGLYLVGVLIGWVWTAYNSLVNLRLRVRQGLSQFDVELKRRADLIPNLVAAVEGYRFHESSLQQLVVELRKQQQTVDQAHLSGLKGLAANLSIVAERYPDLKANSPFLALQTSLSEAEQRLALARDYYNSIATFYKTRLEIFPDGVLGRLLGFRAMVLLEAAGFERAPVEVKLAA
jgi:hypothetical protein